MERRDRTDSPGSYETLSKEGLVSLADAIREVFPMNMHTMTVRRWITRGSRAVDGRIVKLEAVMVGGKWFTSHSALQRYVNAVNSR